MQTNVHSRAWAGRAEGKSSLTIFQLCVPENGAHKNAIIQIFLFGNGRNSFRVNIAAQGLRFSSTLFSADLSQLIQLHLFRCCADFR